MNAPQRTALVTEGNRTLGAAIARTLLDTCRRVIVTHTPGNTTIDQWQQAQAAQGYTFAAYEVDVSEYDSAQELARRIYADGHRFDILMKQRRHYPQCHAAQARQGRLGGVFWLAALLVRRMIRLDSGEDDEAENKLKPPPKPPVFDPRSRSSMKA